MRNALDFPRISSRGVSRGAFYRFIAVRLHAKSKKRLRDDDVASDPCTSCVLVAIDGLVISAIAVTQISLT